MIRMFSAKKRVLSFAARLGRLAVVLSTLFWLSALCSPLSAFSALDPRPSALDSPADLPAESTLPGESRKRNELQRLPSESELPGASPSERRTGLPTESELPTSSLEQQAVNFADEPLLPSNVSIATLSNAQIENLRNGRDDLRAVVQPWLRLNMGGHTGDIRALCYTSDGSRICSGGEDKALEVWSRLDPIAAQGRWHNERTIRWQIQRGARGRIYCVDAAPGVVAYAGEGAMGGNSEIWLVDPVSGAMKSALIDPSGEGAPVVSLSISANATMLAAQEANGHALLWRQHLQSGMWSSTELSRPDQVRYGPKAAELFRKQTLRRFAPIAIVGDAHVVMPVYLRQQDDARRPDGIATWGLERVDLRTMQRTTLTATTPHQSLVTAIAVSPNGRQLTSVDSFGSLCVWDLTTGRQTARLQTDAAMIALGYSSKGNRFIAGSGVSPRRNGRAIVQVWDVTGNAPPRSMVEMEVEKNVYAVAMSHEENLIAYTQGAEVIIKSLVESKPVVDVLRGSARPVLRVAFAAEGPIYRIAFGTKPSPNSIPAWERSFDFGEVQLDTRSSFKEQEWLSPDAQRGTWSVRLSRDESGEHVRTFRGENPMAELPLNPELDGRPTCYGWIGDAAGNPFAVAVGTSLQNNIYVYRLEQSPTAKLLRQFRGHEGAVRSLGVSRDGRYLVSGSDDATIRVWNLAGLATDSESVNRWGAEFEIKEGALVVTSIREDGPLYFRGLRTDDVVRSIQWPERNTNRQEQVPDAMFKALQAMGPNSQVVFDYRRRDLARPAFQMLPAWQPLVSLSVSDNREWALWTPAGYYDASFDGHKLFGWQINRGSSQLPEFFLAAQFRKALEQPAVIEKLLSAGSLEAAFRAANQPPLPGDGSSAILDQRRLKPGVRILSPKPGEVIRGPTTNVRAAIQVRQGLVLAVPKAFANGVVAKPGRLISNRLVSGGNEFVYEWEAGLASDATVIIQVIASTDAEAVEIQSVVVPHQTTTNHEPAKLYLVAAGVNHYRDAQIGQLDYAVNNARSVVRTLCSSTNKLYISDGTLLLDDQATRPMWSLITSQYADRLRHSARPDDLLVFFLSGHGVRDAQTDQYYFVPSNATFDDVRSRRYSECLSFQDFAAFADVPCRKLVVLDTCHSGAVQPLHPRDLKAALRALGSDVIFTLTASEGNQEAVEQRDRQLGHFTAQFIEALSGAADDAKNGGNADGIVTLKEAYQFVSAALATDSQSEIRQFPTLGPAELLDYATIPLTRQ